MFGGNPLSEEKQRGREEDCFRSYFQIGERRLTNHCQEI